MESGKNQIVDENLWIEVESKILTYFLILNSFMQPINYPYVINDGIRENLYTKHIESSSTQDIIYNTT